MAAVTVTRTVLAPVTRLVRPVMATAASLSAAVASTATEVVPAATVMLAPSMTFWPATLRLASDVLPESSATTTVTV